MNRSTFIGLFYYFYDNATEKTINFIMAINYQLPKYILISPQNPFRPA